ncbi:diguanylate cyclase (GGDEF)-like protein [Krasilnikovia cinnamomea]|uniref:Diguanylate cyclase (GGDEF)-like protein n=1 Tax=Krasilnikovia cinnamomea TaxID=349313 RepID=A0A4Q7ZN60_9ACTN|nr:GGDEF domain-containing protein [Krasilnikovia cinnamomea]RZU51719.1 diguanylate cyclase (GGDEF)-like protein [Krasilnikovia cinnamomea]
MRVSTAVDRLPVPVTTFGPLHLLAVRVHVLANTGRCREAIDAADAYAVLAAATGDTRTLPFLLQGKMYANLEMGRLAEAAALGERLLRHQRRAGSVLGEAKALCDLARVHVLSGHDIDGMHHLARAGVLLDRSTFDGDRRRSALCSFAEAATTAEMYETAAATYEQLSYASPAFRLVHAGTLLYWGLRLGHVGRTDEGAARLRRSAELTRHHLEETGPPDAGDAGTTAMLALALAKLGDVVPAEKLARESIMPLRAGENHQYARMAHLALGVSLRAQGQLAEARRELVAARELCVYGARPDEPLIIRFEMAQTAREIDDGQSSRDMFEAVESQVLQLWRLRLHRLAMLRQARQREELETARLRAEREIMRDPLTGLGNRRRFDAVLHRIDAGRIAPPLALLLIDLDHFKAVNDAYSHIAGDRVLREVAAILRAHCRAEDVPVRYAGDEFVVFLRGDAAAGREVAERIRAAVARTDILAGVRLTVSVGLAAMTPGMSADALFRAADERLYAAKWSGRNAIAC